MVYMKDFFEGDLEIDFEMQVLADLQHRFISFVEVGFFFET